MKAIDKLREEAQARGRGLEKNFSSSLPFSSSFLTHQPLPLEFFFYLRQYSDSASFSFQIVRTTKYRCFAG